MNEARSISEIEQVLEAQSIPWQDKAFAIKRTVAVLLGYLVVLIAYGTYQHAQPLITATISFLWALTFTSLVVWATRDLEGQGNRLFKILLWASSGFVLAGSGLLIAGVSFGVVACCLGLACFFFANYCGFRVGTRCLVDPYLATVGSPASLVLALSATLACLDL